MERQLNKFQNRVQQEIILKEDEIDRLREDLVNVNADIIAARDNLDKITYAKTQKETRRAGLEKRQKVSVETIKAHLISQHADHLAHLASEQGQLINNIHYEFEEKLSQIEIYSEQLVETKCKSTETEIKKVNSMIEKTRQLIEQLQHQGHDDTEDEIEAAQEIENARLERLEKALQDKNKERLESLLDAKQQLKTCVGHLEESEKEHHNKMEALRLKLIQLDDKYDAQLKRLKDAHQRKLEPLIRKRNEVEKRVSVSMKQMDSGAREHQRNMMAVNQQGEALKLEYQEVCSREQRRDEEDEESKAAETKFQQLKATLEKEEINLNNKRAQNEFLKREIAKLHHEVSNAKKRAQFSLDN